ncbi:sensor histidine kinase [Gordonia sp. NPDC003429]
MDSSTEAASRPHRQLPDLVGSASLYPILVDHVTRGVRIQVVLRLILAVFVVLVIAFDPPARSLAATWTVVGCYVAWCVGSAVAAPLLGLRIARFAWLAVFIDLAALTALAVLCARSDAISWTSDVLLDGLAIIPLIAATQLRPWVCVAVAVPTTVVFFVASAAAKGANDRPWSYVLLDTFVIAALGVGSIMLSRVQRSRVEAIGALAVERSELLDDAMQIEERERRDLAEALHDGALQFVLAARHDVAAARDGDPAALDRIDAALGESSRLLRSTLTTLHPAVLDQYGLAAALSELGRSVEATNRLRVSVDSAGWPDTARTPADRLLYATARELLTNVVKHAHATRAEVTIERDEGRARLVVLDDGVGVADADVDPATLAARLADGHLGLQSRRIRLEAEGGTLSVMSAPRGGTVAIATLPC